MKKIITNAGGFEKILKGNFIDSYKGKSLNNFTRGECIVKDKVNKKALPRIN